MCVTRHSDHRSWTGSFSDHCGNPGRSVIASSVCDTLLTTVRGLALLLFLLPLQVTVETPVDQ